MADRVHPAQESPSPTPHSQAEAHKLEERKLITNTPSSLAPPPARSVSILIPPGETTAPPGTYIVQLPKDQILRDAPPPKRAAPNHNHGDRRRRSRCCSCCLCLLITLLILLIFVAIFAGVFYFVYKPKAPKYSIDSLSIQGFNLTSSSAFSPRMDVSVRAHNPNTKISIYYAKGSSIRVSHTDIGELCTGVLPVFYQPTKNVTIFRTALTSSDTMLLQTQDIKILLDQENKKKIPLNMNMKVPVKIKFGSIKTWTIVFKVRCRITVNNLTKDASIVDKACSVKFKPWE